MKKIILIFLVAAFLAGCKKNTTSPPGQAFLTKIYEGGFLNYEYVYNSAGQLEQIKSYNDQQVVSGLEKFLYDQDGKLIQSINYSMPSNEVTSSGHFKLNASGQVSRRSYYTGAGVDSGELYLHIDQKFNASGKMVRQTWREVDETVSSYREFTYYENGNLKTIESFLVNGLTEEKFYKYNFSPSEATIPPSLVQPVAMPVNYYFGFMVTDKVELFQYDDDVLSYQTEYYMKDRKFDKHGFVTAYNMTAKYILPAKPDEIIPTAFEFTYK